MRCVGAPGAYAARYDLRSACAIVERLVPTNVQVIATSPRRRDARPGVAVEPPTAC
jgi:hypothetical protein